VPGDWSSLGYLLLVAWRSGGTALRADLAAAHPDRAIVRILREVGLSVEEVVPGELAVRGTPRTGLAASGAECPDLLPTLAALACVLPGESRLDEVEILRGKESDRLAGILDLTRAAGAQAVREGGSLRIRPGARVASALEVDSRGDHRLAMSAATLAVLGGSTLGLTGPECVSKSFPGFWQQLAAAGVRAGPRG
jgi:3-phosphoshikimate 1-carboxyvinyltransferase